LGKGGEPPSENVRPPHVLGGAYAAVKHYSNVGQAFFEGEKTGFGCFRPCPGKAATGEKNRVAIIGQGVKDKGKRRAHGLVPGKAGKTSGPFRRLFPQMEKQRGRVQPLRAKLGAKPADHAGKSLADGVGAAHYASGRSVFRKKAAVPFALAATSAAFFENFLGHGFSDNFRLVLKGF